MMLELDCSRCAVCVRMSVYTHKHTHTHTYTHTHTHIHNLLIDSIGRYINFVYYYYYYYIPVIELNNQQNVVNTSSAGCNLATLCPDHYNTDQPSSWAVWSWHSA